MEMIKSLWNIINLNLISAVLIKKSFLILHLDYNQKILHYFLIIIFPFYHLFRILLSYLRDIKYIPNSFKTIIKYLSILTLKHMYNNPNLFLIFQFFDSLENNYICLHQLYLLSLIIHSLNILKLNNKHGIFL